MSIHKPIKTFFILGLPRSGTTLLEQMLDQHSKISVCPEIASGLALWRLNAARRIKDQRMHLLLINYLHDRASFFKTKMSDFLIVQSNREFHYPIDTNGWFTPLILDFVSDKKAEIYGEKTPENIFYIKELQVAFPSSKFIIMERHPIDVIYSIYENASNMHGLNHSAKDILKMIRPLIKRNLNAIIQYKKDDKSQYMFIKYEDLIIDSHDILQRVCHFLGVEFESQMMNFQNKKEFTERGSNMQKIHSLLNEPLNANRINRSFRLMNPDELHYLNNYLKDELKTLGYSPGPISGTITQRFDLRVFVSIIKYQLKLDLINGLIRKLRFQIHHRLLNYLSRTPIQNILKRRFVFK